MINLTVHTIVKNEDRFLWFALQSVLPYASKILVFDTGSTDHTVDIIKSINSPKIIFTEKGTVDRKGLCILRQEQIDKTKTNWFLILDGDEVWPKNEIEKLINAVKSTPSNVKALVNRTKNCIGDVYHYLPENAGKYSLAGHRGHLNIRMIRNTKGLKVVGEYPLESYTDQEGPLEKQDKYLEFVDCWYLHTTYLTRSSASEMKTSGSLGKDKLWEKGLKLSSSELPEVFNLEAPEFVIDPLKHRSLCYEFAALFTTPVLALKRKLDVH